MAGSRQRLGGTEHQGQGETGCVENKESVQKQYREVSTLWLKYWDNRWPGLADDGTEAGGLVCLDDGGDDLCEELKKETPPEVQQAFWVWFYVAACYFSAVFTFAPVGLMQQLNTRYLLHVAQNVR